MAQSKRFSPMRYTAATEEAAVTGALELVGATHDEADYEVLDVNEKGVTVRVKPREANASAPVAQAPVAAPVETPQAEELVTEEDDDYEDLDADEDEADLDEMDDEADSEIEAQLVVDEEDLPSLEEEDEAVEEDEADEESFEDDAYEEGEEDTEESPELEAEPEVEPVAAASEEVIANAQSIAQEFLDKMGMEARCLYEAGATATTVPLIIEGNDVGILIGKHGSTLQAFQYLLNLTVNNGSEPDSGVRVMVDAGNYRARRQNSLEQTARAAAQRARMSGRPVRLDAMPASERRIIHMFLQNEPGITTQSEGREPQRRLVIFPSQGGAGGGSGRYEDRGGSSGGERRGMGGFNRGRGGRGGYRR